MTIRRVIFLATCLIGLNLAIAPKAWADPISTTPRYTFAGNLDYVVTGGTLRSQPNTVNACSLNSLSSAALSGIPAGATVTAAYLYWAGSGSTADLSVTFQGSTTTASRNFTENYSTGSISVDFFSGFADVTGQVTGNGLYSFGGLSVDSSPTYCNVAAVLSGWGLIVIYEHASNPLRVLNIFDGFQAFRGAQITLTPTNFVLPSAPIDGKLGVLSWEGDLENSAPLGGVTENLVFDGQATPPIALVDAFNPLNNQYNSTINVLPSSSTYGVDFDVYDISSRLTAGDTSATTTYASGGDLVLLSAEVISVTNTPVVDLSITKSHSGNFAVTSTGTYTLSVANAGPAPESGPVTVTDTLPTGLSFNSFTSTDGNWGCSAAGQVVTCTHPGPLPAGTSLANIELVVDVLPTAAASVDNTATVAGTEFDPFASNNTTVDTTTIERADLSTSTKSVQALSGLPVNSGDTLRYTIDIVESADVAVSGVSLTDSIDPLLTNMVVVDAGGGTDNSTATTVQIDDLVIPASGTVTIIFEAEVAGGAPQGSTISNTADIDNPADASTTTVSSTDVTVGNLPANGIKPLYFGDLDGSTNSPVLPMTMSRTPLAGLSSPVRVRIRRQDDDRVWQQSPALQAPLSLDGTTMPVYLQMRRNGQTQARDIRVSLSYTLGASTTFIGCQDLTLTTSGASGIVNTETREFVFNVAQTNAACVTSGASAFTIPTGAVINVQVNNDPSGGTGRAIFVYPVSDTTGESSRVELPATTVINVDSVAYYDAAYPAGSQITAASPGQTVYLRTEVSDPFGTFDISQVDYLIEDPTPTTMASGTIPLVNDTGAAIATYEVAYSIPAAPTTGTWTATVTGLEGTEGTVQHSSFASIAILDATLDLIKTVSVVSDPVTGAVQPKAIPQAVLEYVIEATNTNPGSYTVSSVVLDDTLPSNVQLFLGSPPAPLTFVDGTPSSTLTYTFTSLASTTDDIAFSNDGGTTFITPSVDLNGFDITVPRINFIRITPQGTFAPDTGSGSPSFQVRFQIRLD